MKKSPAERVLRAHIRRIEEYRQALVVPLSIRYSSRQYVFMGDLLEAYETVRAERPEDNPAQSREFIAQVGYYLGWTI